MPSKKYNSKGERVHKAVYIEDPKKFYEGTIYRTRWGDLMQIIEYVDYKNVKVRFLDESCYETWAFMASVVDGAVKNPYRRLVTGGYYGEGPYTVVANKKAYKAWEGMLNRANMHNDRQSYYNDSVCDEWFNFQVFCDWYTKYRDRINPKYHNELEIDKDLFQIGVLHKVYSPSTCCLLPKRLNGSLVGLNMSTRTEGLPLGVRQVGMNSFACSITHDEKRIHLGTYSTPDEAFEVYKREKKKLIVELATSYYQDNGITEEAYQAFLNIDFNPYIEDQK